MNRHFIIHTIFIKRDFYPIFFKFHRLLWETFTCHYSAAGGFNGEKKKLLKYRGLRLALRIFVSFFTTSRFWRGCSKEKCQLWSCSCAALKGWKQETRHQESAGRGRQNIFSPKPKNTFVRELAALHTDRFLLGGLVVLSGLKKVTQCFSNTYCSAFKGVVF